MSSRREILANYNARRSTTPERTRSTTPPRTTQSSPVEKVDSSLQILGSAECFNVLTEHKDSPIARSNSAQLRLPSLPSSSSSPGSVSAAERKAALLEYNMRKGRTPRPAPTLEPEPMAAGAQEAQEAVPRQVTMLVECPEGAKAGDVIVVIGPSGVENEVQVPDGVVQGVPFEVMFSDTSAAPGLPVVDSAPPALPAAEEPTARHDDEWKTKMAAKYGHFAATFFKYDINEDRYLDFDEVKGMMEDLGYQCDKQYMTELFATFDEDDIDKDGQISIDEFPALWKKVNGEEIATFRKFDRNNDGRLDFQGLHELLTAQGLPITPEYTSNVLSMFGHTREDGPLQERLTLEFKEFGELWKQISTQIVVTDARTYDEWKAEMETKNGELASIFVRYDTNRDRFLDFSEVQNMMEDLGYIADERYMEELFVSFTANDDDNDGVISFDEFPRLWEQIDGDEMIAFRKYDTDCDGKLSFGEVTDMLVQQGLPVTPEYVSNVLLMFGENGAIEFAQFGGLWKQVGNSTVAHEHAAPEAPEQLSYKDKYEDSEQKLAQAESEIARLRKELAAK